MAAVYVVTDPPQPRIISDMSTQLYSYNVLVYSNASVSAGMHTFQLKNGHPNGEKALVIFDYLVYS